MFLVAFAYCQESLAVFLRSYVFLVAFMCSRMSMFFNVFGHLWIKLKQSDALEFQNCLPAAMIKNTPQTKHVKSQLYVDLFKH